ncbi:MAG: hypothetical protein ACJATT_002790 [Myxococcota bacterium]
MVVSAAVLNGYGALFGGVLLSHVEEQAEAFCKNRLGYEEPEQMTISGFLSQRSARKVDEFVVTFTPSRSRGVLTLACVVSSRGDTIATCVIRVGKDIGTDTDADIALPSGKGWKVIIRHWVIGEDIDESGRLTTRRMDSLVDAAAVVYCS